MVLRAHNAAADDSTSSFDSEQSESTTVSSLFSQSSVSTTEHSTNPWTLDGDTIPSVRSARRAILIVSTPTLAHRTCHSIVSHADGMIACALFTVLAHPLARALQYADRCRRDRECTSDTDRILQSSRWSIDTHNFAVLGLISEWKATAYLFHRLLGVTMPRDIAERYVHAEAHTLAALNTARRREYLRLAQSSILYYDRTVTDFNRMRVHVLIDERDAIDIDTSARRSALASDTSARLVQGDELLGECALDASDSKDARSSYAYASLLANYDSVHRDKWRGYLLNIVLTAATLRRAAALSKIDALPFVVLLVPVVDAGEHDDEADAFVRDTLRAHCVQTRLVNGTHDEHVTATDSHYSGVTFAKIHLWSLVQYRRVFFIDGDAVPRAVDMHRVFEWPTHVDCVYPATYHDALQASWLLLRPSHYVHTQLLALMHRRAGAWTESLGWSRAPLRADNGWLACKHRFPSTDAADSILSAPPRQRGTRWTFGGARLEQGLLWQAFEFELTNRTVHQVLCDRVREHRNHGDEDKYRVDERFLSFDDESLPPLLHAPPHRELDTALIGFQHYLLDFKPWKCTKRSVFERRGRLDVQKFTNEVVWWRAQWRKQADMSAVAADPSLSALLSECEDSE